MGEEVIQDVKGIPYNLKAALFLGSVGGTAALAAFGVSLVSARRQDPESFNKGMIATRELPESGIQLATRALKWGTVYSVLGVSAISATVWFLSGASNMAEFRNKMGEILPRVPRNNPPQSRIEFEGLTDLLNYISADYSKDKKKD